MYLKIEVGSFLEILINVSVVLVPLISLKMKIIFDRRKNNPFHLSEKKAAGSLKIQISFENLLQCCGTAVFFWYCLFLKFHVGQQQVILKYWDFLLLMLSVWKPAVLGDVLDLKVSFLCFLLCDYLTILPTSLGTKKFLYF